MKSKCIVRCVSLVVLKCFGVIYELHLSLVKKITTLLMRVNTNVLLKKNISYTSVAVCT